MNSTTVNFVLSDRSYLFPDVELRRFWDLETIGITAMPDGAMSAKESALLGEFHAFFRIQDQRRVVSLLKKQDIILPNNRLNAERWLGNLREKLDKNDALKEIYYAQMVDYIAKGQVEDVP